MSTYFTILKQYLTSISGEVNLVELARVVTMAELSAPTPTLSVAIAAVKADAVVIFPDPMTRPFLLSSLDLLGEVIGLPR
jgi:hypothetical protein